MDRKIAWVALACLSACVAAGATEQPFSLHPENPHYFLFRGKPTVLVTSGEHYGAVINGRFDYKTYLRELQRNGLNNTRVFVGPYREVPGDFDIADNVLAPRPGDFVAPWPQDGGGKFDLDKWHAPYFARLRDFMREAGRRGVVVEVTLFCPYYKDSMWEVSPLNAKNNVNGVGGVPRTEVLTKQHPELLRVQEKLVRKLVDELSEFDNFFFEICNEPYFAGVTLDWQEHIASVIQDQESKTGRRHLISQNIANGSKRVEKPFRAVSILQFHYSRPASSVGMNYDHGVAIGNNETGFDGSADATYRVQGWEFLMAGGALYNNLDYSFTVGHERGDFRYGTSTPGGGSAAQRRQLGELRRFFNSMPLVKMAPAADVLQSPVPEGGNIRVLAERGAVYAIYIHHGRAVKDRKPIYMVDDAEKTHSLELQVPAGKYSVMWLHPASGRHVKESRTDHSGGVLKLTTPVYSEDLVLRLTRTN